MIFAIKLKKHMAKTSILDIIRGKIRYKIEAISSYFI